MGNGKAATRSATVEGLLPRLKLREKEAERQGERMHVLLIKIGKVTFAMVAQIKLQ